METLSTSDVGIVNRSGFGLSSAGQELSTGHFLFAQEIDHLIIPEPAKREDGWKVDTQATMLINPTPVSVGLSTQIPRRPRPKRLSSKPKERYILLKKYEGYIISKAQNSFSARWFESLSDYPVLEADFDLEELSETDRERAVEGAPLVWTIGYSYEGSTRKRESVIYLRRLPALAESEIQLAQKASEDLLDGIDWE